MSSAKNEKNNRFYVESYNLLESVCYALWTPNWSLFKRVLEELYFLSESSILRQILKVQQGIEASFISVEVITIIGMLKTSKLINLTELDKGFKNYCFSHLKKQYLEKNWLQKKKKKKNKEKKKIVPHHKRSMKLIVQYKTCLSNI